uniref:ATP synthase protein 8 n=1 Tax=Pichia kluyveri TaxID=36015 RepID=S5TFM6_PICKL|nr:ATP synthase F0 subunit 8 [Pichia kluyveri]AGS44227.1 ATP synthase F0 subunit 8 [Pichia kluyveri]
MPQLVPFFFLNTLFYGYIGLFIILLLVSSIILPYILKISIIRNIIVKL